MSFLFLHTKTNSKKIQVREVELVKHLCPYHLPLKVENLTDATTLFFNDFSELKNQQFKSPRDHAYEKNSAWVCLSHKDKRIFIQTDPLGQCPIWLYEDENYIAISPEQKSFQFLPDFKYGFQSDNYYTKICQRDYTQTDFLNIQRLKPGSEIQIDLQKDKVEIINILLPLETVSVDLDMSLETAKHSLAEALLLSAQELPDQKLCSLLSGGIDSSVATSLAARLGKLNTTYNLKTDLGSEATESEETSKHLGCRSRTLEFNSGNILHHFDSVIFSNEVYDGLTAEIILQLDILTELIPTDHTNILTGYGSDLLYGGMLSVKEYLAITATSDTKSLLERTYWSKELSPFLAWQHGKRFFNLYWHPEVIHAALRMPLALSQKPRDKYILRSLAVDQGWLTEGLAFRAKIGMTHGTQINKILSRKMQLSDVNGYAEKTEMALKKYKNLFHKKSE